MGFLCVEVVHFRQEVFSPPYSPDLNPIEMAFAKLKAHLRATAMRTIDELWKAIGQIRNLFPPQEYVNYFEAAGYGGRFGLGRPTHPAPGCSANPI